MKPVLILQRQLGDSRGIILSERREDLRPDARIAPTMIAAADRLPGTEVRWQVAPGGPRPRHPEHAGEDGAVVMGGSTRGRLLWREQRGNARPARIGQFRDGGSEGLDHQGAERRWLLVGPACRVTASGHRLVPAAKGRPGEPDAGAFGWLHEQEQQAADFRHGQRDQALGAPFLPSLAWRRVTSR